MRGQVRGRTKDECWRNYLDTQRTKDGLLLDVIPSNEKDAYQVMKKDHTIGIWTLDFFFTNAEPGPLGTELSLSDRSSRLPLDNGADRMTANCD